MIRDIAGSIRFAAMVARLSEEGIAVVAIDPAATSGSTDAFTVVLSNTSMASYPIPSLEKVECDVPVLRQKPNDPRNYSARRSYQSPVALPRARRLRF